MQSTEHIAKSKVNGHEPVLNTSEHQHMKRLGCKLSNPVPQSNTLRELLREIT